MPSSVPSDTQSCFIPISVSRSCGGLVINPRQRLISLADWFNKMCECRVVSQPAPLRAPPGGPSEHCRPRPGRPRPRPSARVTAFTPSLINPFYSGPHESRCGKHAGGATPPRQKAVAGTHPLGTDTRRASVNAAIYCRWSVKVGRTEYHSKRRLPLDGIDEPALFVDLASRHLEQHG